MGDTPGADNTQGRQVYEVLPLQGRTRPCLQATLARTPEHTSPNHMSRHAHPRPQRGKAPSVDGCSQHTTNECRGPDGCIDVTRQAHSHSGIPSASTPRTCQWDATLQRTKGPPKNHDCPGTLGSAIRGLLRSSSDPRYRYAVCRWESRNLGRHTQASCANNQHHVPGGRSSLGGNQRPPGTYPSNVDTCR